jgi:hypothetical protein
VVDLESREQARRVSLLTDDSDELERQKNRQLAKELADKEKSQYLEDESLVNK